MTRAVCWDLTVAVSDGATTISEIAVLGDQAKLFQGIGKVAVSGC